MLLEICSEKKIRESIVGTFKIQWQWQFTADTLKMLLQDFVNKFLKKNVSEGILEKIDRKSLSPLADFGH